MLTYPNHGSHGLTSVISFINSRKVEIFPGGKFIFFICSDKIKKKVSKPNLKIVERGKN